MFFIVFSSFFLMSVSLGVMFDVYLEDHEKTVESEAKKEKKSLDKVRDWVYMVLFELIRRQGDGGIGGICLQECVCNLKRAKQLRHPAVGNPDRSWFSP